MKASGQITYRSKIIATLSQQLTASFGKGYTYTALTRMCKVAEKFDEKNIARLSQQLSWSHMIELTVIEDPTKRAFYIQLDNIEQFILELGTGFAFIERQKRISVDSEDYHLDLLFYHRKLKRLIVIDLKLGKFKPKHKAQMKLYLRWLQKHEMQEGEEIPIGLLLCSEGNTEHIELLMLDNNQIRVAQYLTELPSKEWFADKLHRSLEIAKQNIIG